MTHAIRRLLLTGIFVLSALSFLSACSPSVPTFHASGSPTRLSEWNLFAVSGDFLEPVSATLVFKPANLLFTDYAQKLRTLWLPPGTQAQWQEGDINFPVGTVLSKTFYFPVDADGVALKFEPLSHTRIDLHTNQVLETRLLVRRENGWDAFPYVWNEEQTEAFLRVGGSSKTLELRSDTETLRFSYFVPNENQCAGCHITEHPDGDLHPLAATAQQMQIPFDTDHPEQLTQIEALQARGWLSEAPAAPTTLSWLDTSANVADRASAYLQVHCGNCHNPQGAADTSALLLDGSAITAVSIGVCKSPVAAGGGAGDRLFAIVPGAPERSILLYRMESTAPDEMMPELGRSLVHKEGIALIRQWIAEMPGTCSTAGTGQ